MTPSRTYPQVSVIVPCFNRAGTISEAITSVLEQSFQDLEVIAVDDHSEDDSRAVMRRIPDPRLRCVDNPGKGAASARNFGVAQATAPWIAFQDSDDLWLNRKLEQQMARLEGSGFVAAYCGMVVKADTDPDTPAMNRHPGPNIAPLEGDILPSLSRGSYLSTQMLVIRRDIFHAAGGFDEDMPALEDWELMLRVAGQGPVAFVDENLVVQRMSPNSITRSSRKRLEAQEYILAKHAGLLDRFPGARAHHHHRIAGAYRRFGDWGRAATHARAALRAAPFSPKYLLNLILLQGLGLLGPFRKEEST